MATVVSGFLLIGGLINAVPPLSEHLKEVTAGRPVVQVGVGLVSTVIGLGLLTKLI